MASLQPKVFWISQGASSIPANIYIWRTTLCVKSNLPKDMYVFSTTLHTCTVIFIFPWHRSLQKPVPSLGESESATCINVSTTRSSTGLTENYSRSALPLRPLSMLPMPSTQLGKAPKSYKSMTSRLTFPQCIMAWRKGTHWILCASIPKGRRTVSYPYSGIPFIL